MRMRWLLVLGLFLLPAGRSARAVNRPNLGSSDDGEVTNTCSGTSNPQTVPYLSASPVVQLTAVSATDSNGKSYTVNVAAYNYGFQDCTSSTPKEFTGSPGYTILLVSVVGPSGAVSGLGLSSFDMQLLLSNPGFFVCGNFGLKLCDLPPDSSPGDQLLQPAPSYGANGTSTVWGFGPVYDLTTSTPIILNSNYPAFYGTVYPIFGGVAVLSASGPICSGGSTTGCNNITAATPYSVTFAPPGVAAVTASSSNFTPLSPTPVNVSAYNLKGSPLTVTATTTPTSYNASANAPTQSNGVPFPTTIAGQPATSYTFPCSATSPTTLQQYLPVWFQFTPTASSKVFVSTAESHYDTVLSVVSPATCNDDTTSTTGTSSLTFSATQGTTYQILATEYPPCSSQPSPGSNCSESNSSDDFVASLSGDSTLYLLVSTPQLTPSPSSLTAFASTLIGQTSAAQTVTLTSNTANFGAGGITGVTASASGDFKVSPASCGNPLPDGAPGCPLSVTFVPTAAGTRTGTLTIASSGATSAGNTPITFPLSGTGVTPAPAVGLSPLTTLTFTTPQVINTSSAVSNVVVTNTGTASLTVSAVTPSGDFSETDNCKTGSIAANGTCTVMVTFTPTATGTRSGQLTLTDNAANSPQSLGLSGTGILPSPTISFTVANQTYGAAPFTVSVSSNSTGTITYSVVSGNATVSGSTVTLTGIGPVVLQASQAATASYTAGTQNASFTVAAGAPAITFSVANQTYGAAPFTVSANSNSVGTHHLLGGQRSGNHFRQYGDRDGGWHSDIAGERGGCRQLHRRHTKRHVHGSSRSTDHHLLGRQSHLRQRTFHSFRQLKLNWGLYVFSGERSSNCFRQHGDADGRGHGRVAGERGGCRQLRSRLANRYLYGCARVADD